MTLKHYRDMTAVYGRAEVLSPLIRRVLAPNPGPFTFHGTGTYIVGRGEVAVIDPGPDDPGHIEALVQALAGQTLSHIVVTHSHADHCPAARPLQRRLGGEIVGCAPHGGRADEIKVEEGHDAHFAPDRVLAEGQIVAGPGWTLAALSTPGHCANHLCFRLEQERALFSGDHVMGWSTSVVSPPDGDMAAYITQLRRLLDHDDAVYWPTHGPAVTDPKGYVATLIEHRLARESQILAALAAGPANLAELVGRVYAEVPMQLWPAAARSLLAHLLKLRAEGRIGQELDPSDPTDEAALYRLS